jgi:hypothetical protein
MKEQTKTEKHSATRAGLWNEIVTRDLTNTNLEQSTAACAYMPVSN